MSRKILIGVIGGSECAEEVSNLAEEVGGIVAGKGFVLVCGGLGGVMEAACRGAKRKGGLTVGIIPGENKEEANRYCDIVIPTGMGYTRNALVAGAADVVVALSGKYGTLSEIAFALNAKKKVYGIGSWDIDGIEQLSCANELRSKLQ